MTSSLSCSGVLTDSVTRFALILPHCECVPMPMASALQSSPSVIRQEDRRKQSPLRFFFRSSGSPVSDDSFDSTLKVSSMIASAGTISPACAPNAAKVSDRRGVQQQHGRPT